MNEHKQSILKLIKHFSFKSIFFKYLKNFTIIILLPFLILNFVVFFSYRSIMSGRTAEALSQSTFLAYTAISQQFENADNTFVMITNDYYIDEFLNNPMSDYSPRKVVEKLTYYVNKTENLHSATIYSFSNSYIFSTNGSGGIERFEGTDWFRNYTKTGLTNFVINSKVESSSSAIPVDVLTFCYGVHKGSNCHGMVVLNYNTRDIDTRLSIKNSEFTLTDLSDNVIYSTEKALLGEKLKNHFDYPKPVRNITEISPERFGNIMSGSCRFETKPINLVSMTTQQNSYLNVVLTFSILTSILLPILIALYISISSYRTITEIITGFSSLETAGNENDHSNEINFIMQNLMQVLNKSKNIQNELADKMALLKKTQLAAMQLQFNQHFLFNTLNLISMSARAEAGGKKNTTSSAISLLADLLRISLNTEQYIVTVFVELMYAKKYIEIEQLKLKNMFTVVWDVDEDLYECKIVKLIFQPIIENAFRHGLQPLPPETEKRLSIKGYRSGDNIEFHIIDNGVGIPKDKLAQINTKLQSNVMSEANHIGISNVNARLKLVFGDEYGLSVSSDQSGTDVKILIPDM